VVETSFRDEQYTQTRFVTETAEREEQVTSFRPVTETQIVQQQHTVQRPVVETQLVQQQFAVQRPVVETQFQTQQHIAMRPVTTIQNQTVDAGGFVAQQVVQPGQVQYGLQWIPNAFQTTGPFGIFSRNRSAAVWTPQVTPPTVQTQLAYRPNLVTQQVAQTSFVPEVQQQQVPVSVMRMQTEMVAQQVPVQVMRMQSEVVTQEVPVQTTRMVPVVEVRKIPYTVQRPITETLTRQVPVQQQRWVTEEQVRRVPVVSTRIEYETRREPIQVQYTENEKVVQKVRRPVVRQKYIPYTETVMVPRQVVQRVPLSYYDPFAPAILNGYSSFSSPIVSSTTVPSASSSPSVTSERPALADEPKEAQKSPQDDAGPSVLNAPENDLDQPRTQLKKVESYTPDSNNDLDASEPASPGDEAPSDNDELKAPVLESASASYRIKFRPIRARSI
jgi:hypothetical protein